MTGRAREEDSEGDRAAHHHATSRETWLQELYSDWRMPLLRYVHRLTGDPDAAEDVTQEAFLRLAASARAGDALRSPQAWLFRVAGNLVRDGARRDATRRRASLLVDTEREAPRPDHDLDRSVAVEAVRTALDVLPARDREALLMRQSGFEYSEIARVLGIQPQSVPSVVMRALRRFRDAYASGGGDER